MTKEEKIAFVQELSQKFKENPNFFILDLGGFTVEKTSKFRAKCYEQKVELKMCKNTLIKKSLEAIGGDYSPLFPVLKETSFVMFVKENPNSPAKMIKEFRDKDEKPKLKAAFVENTFFTGDQSLEQLIHLKSKTVLLGELVTALQSPIKNVIGGLQASSGQKIAGLLKAIEEKKS